MTISRTYNGYIKIETIHNGQLITKKYMYYTISQAKKAFKEYLKTL